MRAFLADHAASLLMLALALTLLGVIVHYEHREERDCAPRHCTTGSPVLLHHVCVCMEKAR